MSSILFRTFLSFTAGTLVLLPCASLAKDSALVRSVPAEKIISAVTKSGVLDDTLKQQVYSSYEGGVVSVSLFRHTDATRADCKIDAVLLARKIIALDPRDIKLVRCVFYDYEKQNEYWEVEVRAQLVSAFSQGKIGEQELINSVLLSEDKQKNVLSSKFAALSYSGILSANSVCKGALEDKRLAISLRLKELEKQGIELGHFREDFLRIEDAARRGKGEALPTQISSLNKGLDDYEQEMIRAGQLQKPELRRSKNSIGIQDKRTGSHSGTVN